MPGATKTARLGISVAQRLGATRRDAAMAVMLAARAAAVSLRMDGQDDTSWLRDIHDEAQRVWLMAGPLAPPGPQRASLAEHYAAADAAITADTFTRYAFTKGE